MEDIEREPLTEEQKQKLQEIFGENPKPRNRAERRQQEKENKRRRK